MQFLRSCLSPGRDQVDLRELRFSCCDGGKVELPLHTDYLQILQELLTTYPTNAGGLHASHRCRGRISHSDTSIQQCFRLHVAWCQLRPAACQSCWRILHLQEGGQPVYAQLHFYDSTEEQLRLRANAFRACTRKLWSAPRLFLIHAIPSYGVSRATVDNRR